MIELEDRLRSALATLSEEVPPSSDARAELDRRLHARRRVDRRRSALAVAAAAVVILAGVTTPVLQGRSGEQGAAPTSTTPIPPPHPSHVLVPSVAATSDIAMVGTFSEFGQEWFVLAYFTRIGGPAGVYIDEVCVAGLLENMNDPPRHPNSDCTSVHDGWPAGQPPHKVETLPVLGDGTLAGGPLPNLLLFVTLAEVHTLEVRAGDGSPVPVKQLTRTDRLTLFVADFGGPSQGFGYTARDAAGNVVEQVIT